MRDDFGRPNYGGMAGAAVGGIGGLFALGLIPAIVSKDPHMIFYTPLLNLICWVISLVVGWFVGGFVGRPLGNKFRSDRAEIIGGIVGGIVPVALIALAGWRLWRG